MLSRAGLANWCVVMYGLVIRGTDHYVKKAQSLFALIKFLHICFAVRIQWQQEYKGFNVVL